MSYSTNPMLAKARGNAMKELLCEGKDVNMVARRYGVNRTTIWRWKNKWLEINRHVQLVNYNRPNRTSLASPYDHVVANARAITGKNLYLAPVNYLAVSGIYQRSVLDQELIPMP